MNLMRVSGFAIAVISAGFLPVPSMQSAEAYLVQQQYVMPQAQARSISGKLGNWTMQDGDRPSAAQLSRDCLRAGGYMMQASYNNGAISDAATISMGFWSSVVGAATIIAVEKGQDLSNGEGDTSFTRKFQNDEHKAEMRAGEIPAFVRAHHAECESIRKRFDRR